jgi:hypothetical protein
MHKQNQQRLPSALTEVEEQLRNERQHLDAIALDRIKLRAMSAGRAVEKGPLMKSRLATTMVLVVGIMLSTAGAGLAITGATDSQNGNAGATASGGNPGQTLGQVGGSEDQPQDRGGTQGGNQVLGGADTGNTNPQAQVAATGNNSQAGLPFTGLLAIPLLIGGVALLGSGLLLRRRTREA